MQEREKILPAQLVYVLKHSLGSHLFSSPFAAASIVNDMQMSVFGLLLL